MIPRTAAFTGALRGQLTRQHVEHVGHLLSIPDFAEMAAVIVDDDPGTERILQPGEFALG